MNGSKFLLGALVLGAGAFLFLGQPGNQQPAPQQPMPVLPVPMVPDLKPVPFPVPMPVVPTPNPAPIPIPARKIAKVVAIYQDGCPPCDRMKKETWLLGVECVWLRNTPEFAQLYQIQGTPTLIGFDENYREVRRLVGYRPRREILEWIKKGTQ